MFVAVNVVYVLITLVVCLFVLLLIVVFGWLMFVLIVGDCVFLLFLAYEFALGTDCGYFNLGFFNI